MHQILFLLGKVISSIGLLLLFITSSYGWGYTLFSLIGVKTLSRSENYLFSIIIGMGIVGHFVLFSGLGNFLYPLTAIILLIGGILLALISFWKQRVHDQKFIIKLVLPHKINWFHVGLIVIILVNLCYSFLANVLTPPISLDEVAYHMAAPKIYADTHSITYLDSIPYTNWPFETEMLFTYGLLLSSETFAHLITWVALILTCLSFSLFGRKYFTESSGLIAAAIFSSTPVVMTIAGSGLIELPLTMYIVVATLTLINWFLTGDKSYFILSGLFSGFAASTKLNAAVIPVILGICIIFQTIFIRRNSILKGIKQFSLYGLLSLVVVLPWYLKTWYQTGNPFWPFFWNFLGGRNWDALGSQYLFGFVQSPNMPLTINNWLLGLWKISSSPSLFGSQGFETSWLYIQLLPISFLALLFYKSKYKQAFYWLSIISLAFYTNWFLQTHQTRFLMPVIGILSLNIGIGVTWFLEIRSLKWNVIWSWVFILFLLSTSWVLKPSYRMQIYNNRSFLAGSITRTQFLEEHSPGYEVFDFINKNLPSDVNIWLALYEVRGYYLDRNYSWANPISQRAIPMEKFRDSDQLANELRRRGISYILLQTSTIDAYSNIKFGDLYSALIRSLVEQHGQLIYSNMQEELYKLVP
jgi:hypothetical protein